MQTTLETVAKLRWVEILTTQKDTRTIIFYAAHCAKKRAILVYSGPASTLLLSFPSDCQLFPSPSCGRLPTRPAQPQCVKYDQTWTLHSCHEGRLSAAQPRSQKTALRPSVSWACRADCCAGLTKAWNESRLPEKSAWGRRGLSLAPARWSCRVFLWTEKKKESQLTHVWSLWCEQNKQNQRLCLHMTVKCTNLLHHVSTWSMRIYTFLL